MFRLFIVIGLGLFFSSCGERNNTKPSRLSDRANKKVNQILIQPFTGVDTQLILQLKKDLVHNTGLIVKTGPVQSLPAFAFYKPRQRYTADSLLVFLKGLSGDASVKIIGVTDKDISTPLRGSPSWGVMGLALSPGPVCVISSFRVTKGIRNAAHLRERMRILALHELGHTMGLPHCTKDCLMRDAEGKMNLDNAANYCPDCFLFLREKGFLRARQ